MADLSKDVERVSRFGEYSGFTEPIYGGWVRTSLYVEVRDGTRLAVDVYRPTRDGAVETAPLPVVWKAKRYLRATMKDGELQATLLSPGGPGNVDQSLAPRQLISHGYVLAAADMRGTGASFGTWSECSDPSASTDGYDITEWLASQPWCDGNVGMFGSSYEGRMQLNTASAAPPHLKAIMPEVSPFDWYEIIHEGGVYSARFDATGDHFRACDVGPPVAWVDDDPDGLLAAEASKEHEVGNEYGATKGELPFRDSTNVAGVTQWLERSGEALIPGIVRSGVASYHTSGFFARVGLDQLLWFANLARSETGQRHRIWMGPWPGGGLLGSGDPEVRGIWVTEAQRFFDYWLKGIDNGIMDEPPVVYSTSVSTTDRIDTVWRFADSWPLPQTQLMDFYLRPGPSGSIGSSNDGLLAAGDPVEAHTGKDDLTVDYGLSAPAGDQLHGGEAGADFSSFESGNMTYTTSPLATDVEVTGHPVVHLFVSTSADDGDFIVHLTDVDNDGISTYVTRERLRASHRATAPAPCYWFDVPWHAHNQAESQPVPRGEVVELAFALLPTSYLFRSGHRIRMSIAGANLASSVTPVLDPRPELSVHRDAAHPSRLSLPVVGVDGRRDTGGAPPERRA